MIQARTTTKNKVPANLDFVVKYVLNQIFINFSDMNLKSMV